MHAFTVTIDGPSGVGKGVLAQRIAKQLGLHMLDSGALYRALAIYAEDNAVDNPRQCAQLAKTMQLVCKTVRGKMVYLLDDRDITNRMRTEQTANTASALAASAPVREALLPAQRRMLRPPGLVADGRDMGTVVFPNAEVKLYLTADVQARAQRRFLQLQEMGKQTALQDIAKDMQQRDERDTRRLYSPLAVPEGALVIDTTRLSVDEVYSRALRFVQSTFTISKKNK